MSLFRFLKQIWSEFGRDKAGQMSAAFAYIAVFSVGPLLLVLISIAGYVFGQRAVEGQLFGQLSGVVGADAAKSIQSVIAHTRQSDNTTLALLFGVVGTILGAIGLTNQLQNSCNAVFRAVPDPRAGLKVIIYTKLKNIALLVMGSLAVVASVVLSVMINGLGEKVRQYVDVPAFGLELLNATTSLLVFVVILYLIYRVLPDVVIPRKLALNASIIISLLFLIGKIILGLIIGHNGTASAYGAAASVIVLMLWFYYAAQILLLGAEGIKVYGLHQDIHFLPKRFTLMRKSLDVDIKGNVPGRMIDAFARGYDKKSKK